MTEKPTPPTPYCLLPTAPHYWWLYLSLSQSTVLARIKVAKLVKITGISPTANPYTIHKKTPIQKVKNIPNEISLADLLFQVLRTWGRKEMVVRVPARRPTTVMGFSNIVEAIASKFWGQILPTVYRKARSRKKSHQKQTFWCDLNYCSCLDTLNILSRKNYGARALPRSKLPMVLAVIFIWVKGLAGTTVLYK